MGANGTDGLSTDGSTSVSASSGARKRVKLDDVARAAGLSLATVSRALGGYSDIALGTRERVARLAEEMGYHPSSRAQSLASGGRSGLARCAVVSLGSDPEQLTRSLFSGVLLSGMAARAAAERMDLHLVSLSQEPAAWARSLAALHAADRADGLLLLTFLGLEPAHVEPLDEAGVPYVLVNRHFGDRPVHCVTVDYGAANESVVEHLAGLGHRRLALLAPSDASSTVQDHLRGWQRGVERCALSEEDAPVVRFRGAHHDAGYEVGGRLLAEGLPGGRGRPTAIVGFNDFVAHGVLRAAARAGVAVPGELSVIGFNNLVARYTSPPLCSHEFHLPELGAAAVSLLAAAMRGELPAPTRKTFTPEFVCR